jgi:tetratricopeptide (TPR) repeat protein
MIKRFLSLTILFVLLVPAVVSGQIRGQAKMLGIVLDEETGQPLEGVTVKAYFPAADAAYSPAPTTNAEGRWKILFIRAGMWNLDLGKVGYLPQKISQRVVFEMGAKVPEIEIRLRKMKGVVVREDIVKEVEKGERLFAEKKYSEALAVYRSILEKYPDFYIIKMNIGACYFAQGNYEKALEEYLQVYEKQPDRGDLLIAIANTYNNWGKLDEAIAWYQKVPVSDIRDIDSAYNTGAVFLTSGNQADALKYFRKAIEIDPQFAEAYYQLGLCHVGLGSTPEAIAALNKFIELAPESPDAATAKAIVETLAKK